GGRGGGGGRRVAAGGAGGGGAGGWTGRRTGDDGPPARKARRTMGFFAPSAPAAEPAGLTGRRGLYRFRFTTSCSISSLLVITRPAAWNPRWVTIIRVNSCARSTFDISSPPLEIDDWLPSPEKLSTGSPEFEETVYMFSPVRTSPAGLVKSASITWPSVRVRPLVKLPVITPYSSIE